MKRTVQNCGFLFQSLAGHFLISARFAQITHRTSTRDLILKSSAMPEEARSIPDAHLYKLGMLNKRQFSKNGKSRRAVPLTDSLDPASVHDLDFGGTRRPDWTRQKCDRSIKDHVRNTACERSSNAIFAHIWTSPAFPAARNFIAIVRALTRAWVFWVKLSTKTDR